MDPATLISGGIKLISGIFGRNSQKKAAMAARTQARQDFFDSGYDTRYAAEKGGFNPLTFLAATGGGPGVSGGFSGGGIAPLASTELITGGLLDIGDSLSGRAAQETARRKLDLDLGRLALETGKANLASLTNPKMVSGSQTIGSAPSLGKNTTVVPSATPWPLEQAALDPITPYKFLGFDITPSPLSSDAEALEARGGEIASEVGGISNILTDIGHTFAPGLWESFTTKLGQATRLMLPLSTAPSISINRQAQQDRFDNYVDPNTPFQMWK